MISMYSATVKMVILFAVKINFCWCKATSGHCFFVFSVWVLLFLIKFVDTKYPRQWQGKNSFLGHQKVHEQKCSQPSPLNQKATPATILTSSISAKSYNSLIQLCVAFPLSEQAAVVSLFYLFWVYICMHRNNNVIENSIELRGCTFYVLYW